MNDTTEREPFWPLITVVAVLAVATFSISMSLDWWGSTVSRSGLMTALVLMVLADVQMLRDYRHKKARGIPKSDERLDRIVVYASTYSFRVGLICMIALIVLHLLRIVDMDVVTALSVSVLVMAGIYFAFHLYFDRRGDVV